MVTDALSLGQICVDRGYITQSQLDQCLEIQKSADNWRRLGEVLLDEGHLTGTALVQMLSIQEAQRQALPAEVPAEEPLPDSELGWLLKETRAYGAESIVLGAGHPPAFHFCGRVELLQGPPLGEEQIIGMLKEALPAAMLVQLDAAGNISSSLTVSGFEDVRVTLYRSTRGVSAVLRPQTPQITELANLGLPAGVGSLTELTQGLVLVTGPAGSGRATTLNCLLDAINRTRACHIVTLEAPMRLILERHKAWITQREIGRDAKSFSAGLQVALRIDADVIALTSMDDTKTIKATVDAAQNGKLAIGLMHTNGACETIQRLLAAGITKALLASSLRGILTQHMLPSTDDHTPVPAAELLLCTPGIANVIREDRIDQIPNILHVNRSEGMAGLDDALTRLYRKGRIRLADALARATDLEKMRQALSAKPEVSRVSH